MFTGIIEATGTVVSLKKKRQAARLTLRLPVSFRGLKAGGSLSVNGVCLTMASRKGASFSFDLVQETLRRTTLGHVLKGDYVNLERPMRASDRVHGHFVLGHVDGVGKITAVFVRGRARDFSILFPRAFKRYFVEKGSVAVDGVSLTIGRVKGNSFTVHLIPQTLRRTVFGRLKRGSRVNLEADILMKGLAGRRSID